MVRFGTVITLLFLYIPLVVVVIYAFNDSVAQVWPPKGFTTKWFSLAFGDANMRAAFLTSIKVASITTLIALGLGSAAAFAVHRYRFFGRQAISFVLVLPIALPGIITGMALRTGINTVGINFSLWTIMIGHATFCIVVVFNNVAARLRRLSGNIEEASMDLGATRFTTFRLVTLPNLGSALLAGALLAFALSFDEIVVTTFTSPPDITTLPLWINTNILGRSQAPIVNVVAAALILLSVIPIYFSQKLSGDQTGGRL